MLCIIFVIYINFYYILHVYSVYIPLQILFFLLYPLYIYDYMLQKLPWFFAPNTITVLQNEKLSFTQVQRRKRLDRLLQFMFLVLTGWGLKTIGVAAVGMVKVLMKTRVVL